MLQIEELADGIVQITHRGTLDKNAWQEIQARLTQQTENHTTPPYILFNMSATTKLDPIVFGEFITAPVFNDMGLAILVARRAHLQLARKILSTYPDRDRIQLRMMSSLEDALSVLLDKQTMDKINGVQRFGG